MGQQGRERRAARQAPLSPPASLVCCGARGAGEEPEAGCPWKSEGAWQEGGCALETQPLTPAALGTRRCCGRRGYIDRPPRGSEGRRGEVRAGPRVCVQGDALCGGRGMKRTTTCTLLIAIINIERMKLNCGVGGARRTGGVGVSSRTWLQDDEVPDAPLTGSGRVGSNGRGAFTDRRQIRRGWNVVLLTREARSRSAPGR